MHRVVPSEPCPELNCAESEQIALSDRCCKVCRGMEEASSYSTLLLCPKTLFFMVEHVILLLLFSIFQVYNLLAKTEIRFNLLSGKTS